jgi:hypothetical protein
LERHYGWKRDLERTCVDRFYIRTAANRSSSVGARMIARHFIGLFAFASVMALCNRAEAAKQHFEPTDLDLQDPGSLNLDLQFGWVKGPDRYRFVAPDTEINLGVTDNVELDVDLAYGVEATLHPLLLNHAIADNVWISTKIGLWAVHDFVNKTSWSMGIQLGPKIAAAPSAHGIGYEALFLLGRKIERTHVVLNLGGLIDPGAQFDKKRPIGFETGLDLRQDLDENGVFAMLGELGWIHYFSADPDQLQLTYGFQLEPNPDLDFSVIGLLGVPPGGDHYGVLLGYAPSFALWN